MSNYLSVSSLTKYLKLKLIRIPIWKGFIWQGRSPISETSQPPIFFIKGWKSGHSGDCLGWGLSKLWFWARRRYEDQRHWTDPALWAKWELFHCHWKGWARWGRGLGHPIWATQEKVDRRRSLSGSVEASSATVSKKDRGHHQSKWGRDPAILSQRWADASLV